MTQVRKYNYSGTGVETSTQPAAGTPTADDDLVTKGYVDVNTAAIEDLETQVDANTASISTNTTNITNLDTALDSHEADTSVHGVAGDVLGTTDDQTVTGKTFDDELRLKEIATPSNPGAGYKKIYPKSDGKLYTLSSGGIEQEVGSGGGGGGGKNYFVNPDAESDVATGTSATANMSITEETTETVRGARSFLIASTASCTTSDYAAFSQDDMDYADKNDILGMSFDVRLPSGSAFSTGDWEVVMIKDPDGTPVEKVLGDVPSNGEFYTTFVTDDSDNYELRLRVVTSGVALSLVVDNFKFGPELAAQGVPSTPSSTVALTEANFSTDAGLTIDGHMTFKRDGGELIAAGSVSFVGTGSNSGNLTFDLNSIPGLEGIGVTSGKYGSVIARTDNNTNTSRYANVAAVFVADGTDSLEIALSTASVSAAGNAFGNTGALIDQLSFSVILPIAEWAGSSVNLSVSKADYVSNSDVSSTASVTATGFQNGPGGENFSANFAVGTQYVRRVRFPNSIQPTDKIEIKIADSSGIETAGVVSMGYHLQNGIGYGMWWIPVSGSTTDVDIVFGNGGRRPGATYGSNGSPFSDLTSYTWGVVKYPGVIQTATPYRQRIERLTLDNDYTAGEVLVARMGNIVTISMTVNATHASLNTAVTSTGFLPEWARPENTASNAYWVNDAEFHKVNILANGTIQTQYWTASNNLNKTGTNNLTVSYAIDD